MAASSSGKLDAICARLKSSQQSSAQTHGTPQQDCPARDIKLTLLSVGLRNSPPAEKNGLPDAARFDSSGKDGHWSLCREEGEGKKNSQAGVGLSGASPEQNSRSTPSEEDVSDNSIINEGNKNNNNNIEVTDYNEKVFSVNKGAYSTADLSTAVKNAAVLTDTAVPTFCNENCNANESKFVPGSIDRADSSLHSSPSAVLSSSSSQPPSSSSSVALRDDSPSSSAAAASCLSRNSRGEKSLQMQVTTTTVDTDNKDQVCMQADSGAPVLHSTSLTQTSSDTVSTTQPTCDTLLAIQTSTNTLSATLTSEGTSTVTDLLLASPPCLSAEGQAGRLVRPAAVESKNETEDKFEGKQSLGENGINSEQNATKVHNACCSLDASTRDKTGNSHSPFESSLDDKAHSLLNSDKLETDNKLKPIMQNVSGKTDASQYVTPRKPSSFSVPSCDTGNSQSCQPPTSSSAEPAGFSVPSCDTGTKPSLGPSELTSSRAEPAGSSVPSRDTGTKPSLGPSEPTSSSAEPAGSSVPSCDTGTKPSLGPSEPASSSVEPAGSSVRSSGRKKSRKAANPQKQITAKVYADLVGDFEIESVNSDPAIPGENYDTDGPEIHPSHYPASCPLDLSCASQQPSSPALSTNEGQIDKDCGYDLCAPSVLEKGSLGGKKGLFGPEGESSIGSNAVNAPLEHADSNMLVDFACNTMKELLGIYGFEGPEAKSGHLSSIQSFPSGIVTEDTCESVDEYVSEREESSFHAVAAEDLSEERKGHGQRAQTKTSKPSPFRKAAYVSMAPSTPSPDTDEQNKTANSKVSSTKGKISSSSSSPPVQMIGPTATSTAKYALSKKSYTQKVLNSVDFNKYIKRYGNGVDCGGKLCQDLGYRDHYHCLDCPHKVFIRKEEMVRHYKWHKKRHDSLQHGFMRYSPMDDCSKKYGNCGHNGRQTHYHCVQRGCDKVYVSTSDVQMHANFHRKDSAIIQEGFQRFRATEDCGTMSCNFYGQRTTHFHCRRPQCNFTFKNKADMEKHKSYHQKDEVLSRDGFKKFMKYESCPYNECRYSKISNHIHCIRPGCQYVLHSTAQLYSHKRKHERREFEHAYRNFRHIQQVSLPKVGKEEGAKSSEAFQLNQRKILPHPGAKITGIPIIATETGLQIDSSVPSNLIMKTEALPVQGFSVISCVDSAKNLVLNGSLYPTVHTARGAAGGAENLGRVVNSPEDARQTMALPIRLVGDNSNSSLGECTADVQSELKKDEPEDLSMPAKTKEHIITFPKESVKEETVNEEESFDDEDDDDEDDDDEDDDDDDDDDTDYGKVEEPTLVNTFGSSFEGDSSHIPLLGSSKEIARAEPVKMEIEGHASAKTAAAQQAIQPMVKEPPESETVHQPMSHQAPPTLMPQAVLTPTGKVLGVNIPVKLIPEKKERDESWKKYLIRYTANDACFSRCACLYKDHYHCRLEGCQVIFRSKDGVRGHARFHELQDSITPLVYCKFESTSVCSSAECQYNGKEEHYHCNWTNCNQVIPASAPTFARLEHYRIHEYATSSVGKNKNSSSSGSRLDLDPLQKRRGRPPKYPKYDLPVVPKVHLTEKEILDSTLAFLHNKCNENSKIINGFKKFQATEPCPDDQCLYRDKDHYHCGRKFCHMSTDRLDVLNLHAKDFHNNVTILEGFEFFERMVNCRRSVCHNNRINRHYHCMRPRCDYSFVRHSTMAQHNKKHPTVTSAVLSSLMTRSATTPSSAQNKSVIPQFIPIAPAVTYPTPVTNPSSSLLFTTASTNSSSKTVVKSSGTFYPVSTLPKRYGNSSQNLSPKVSSHIFTTVTLTPGVATTPQVLSHAQMFQTPGGTPVMTSGGGLCLTLPHNIVTTAIPVVAQSKSQQTGVLAEIIPVGQLSPHKLSGGQIIATPQGHILQQGPGVVQVIQTPSTVSPIASFLAPTVSESGQPMAVLLQHSQLMEEQGISAPLNWAHLKKRMHYSLELNCGRPFCKLKKKDHYHCLDCNQAFSDPTRLRTHIGKHGFKFKKSDRGIKSDIPYANDMETEVRHVDLSASTVDKDNGMSENDSVDDEGLSSSLNLQPSVFTNMVTADTVTDKCSTSSIANGRISRVTGASDESSLTSSNIPKQRGTSDGRDNLDNSNNNHAVFNHGIHLNHDDCLDSLPATIDDSLDESTESSLNASSSSLTLCSSLSRKSGRKRTSTRNDDFVSSNTLVIPSKLRKTQRDIKAEAHLPEGYKRVRCGEDCGYVRCAYRQTVTHFHCLRSDCGYGFSDKSRIMQHRIRHERLDALMGGEFQQFRASVSCEKADCEFNEKASHFHCLKCSYSCADSSKVPAHRKYHTKLDNISNNGFLKYTGTTDCQISACSYFRKQTHYHCTFPGCNHAVLGPSQMAPHKLKHAQHQPV